MSSKELINPFQARANDKGQSAIRRLLDQKRDSIPAECKKAAPSRLAFLFLSDLLS